MSPRQFKSNVQPCWTGANVLQSSESSEKLAAWLFKNTRVPVLALFGNLKDGATVDNFLEWFPGVTREQVEAVLKHVGQSLSSAGARITNIAPLPDKFARKLYAQAHQDAEAIKQCMTAHPSGVEE